MLSYNIRLHQVCQIESNERRNAQVTEIDLNNETILSLVANEGNAPSQSACKTDVLLLN